MEGNTNNIDNKTVAKRNVRTFLILIALVLIPIIFVGCYFYNNYSKISNSNENSVGTQQEEKQDVIDEDESVFSSIMNEDSSSHKKYSYEESLRLYEDYEIISQGIPAKYINFNEDSMAIKASVPLGEDGGFVNKEYYLAEDFIIICTTIDPSCTFIDYNNISDDNKVSMVDLFINVSLEKKISLLNSYTEGTGMSLSLDNSNGNPKVKKVLLINEFPDSCYDE